MTTTVALRKTGASWQFIQEHSKKTNSFGPYELKGTFNLEVALRSTPAVFSDEVILRALNMDCCIVLQHDQEGSKGKPLTLQYLHETFRNKDMLDGTFLFNTEWYQGEPFFTTDTPRPGLFIKGRDVIQGSTGKTFIGESLIAAKFVEVLFGDELPEQYGVAIEELRTGAGRLERLCQSNWIEGGRQCVGLAFSRFFRESPVEVFYRILLAQKVNRERLFEGLYTRTNRLSSDGGLVAVGYAGAVGAGLSRWSPGYADDDVGFSFSCSGELEPVG